MMLYIRMLLTMGVSLYTSRVVLNTLGIEEFGIYNVVAGVVVLFSFLNGALTQATQRFLTYELGKQNLLKFKQVFSISLLVYLGLSLIIIILGESIGLWFLNTQLNIAEERMVAANWTYQFTLVTFFLNMMCTPYNAAIVAHEKMSFYAYISIVEVILKLLIVYLLMWVNFDKLISYSILTSVVSFVVLLLYVYFCLNQFSACRFFYYWNKKLFYKLVSFSGWSIFGSLSVVATNQGVNMLLNIFFGVVVNAAMGVTNQISNAVNQFVLNFQVAFNPQITKSYASGDKPYLESLIFRSAKISYLLLFLISLPILIKTEAILQIWLGSIPQYTVLFCRFTIISLLIDTLSGPLWMIIQAKGKIRNYQLIISSIFWLNLISSFILFSLGYSAVFALIVRCVVSVVLLFTRLILFVSMLNFPSKLFCRKVILNVVCITFVVIPFPLLIGKYTDGMISLILTVIVSFLFTILFSYLLGLNAEEKKKVKIYILNRINK